MSKQSDDERMCIGLQSKDIFNRLLDEKLEEKDISKEQINLIFKVKTDLNKLDICKPERVTRKKRKPSKYNIFIGECLRGEVPEVKFKEGEVQPEKMRACAVQWKEVKKKQE